MTEKERTGNFYINLVALYPLIKLYGVRFAQILTTFVGWNNCKM